MTLRPQLRYVLAQILRSLMAGAGCGRAFIGAAPRHRRRTPVFPIGSRLGFVPPNDLKPATTFPGFENEQKGVFVRLIALPGNAFPEIEKTMTNDALEESRA
jgi:hypothetical protein